MLTPEMIQTIRQQIHSGADVTKPRTITTNIDTAADLIDEIEFWRKDAAARIQVMYTVAVARSQKGNERGAIDMKVNYLLPTVNALSQALAGEYHVGFECELCGKPVRSGDLVVGYDDVGDVHVNCQSKPGAYIYKAGDEIRIDKDSLDVEAMKAAGTPIPENPVMTVHVFDDMFGPEKIAETLAKAEAFLHRPDDEIEPFTNISETKDLSFVDRVALQLSDGSGNAVLNVRSNPLRFEVPEGVTLDAASQQFVDFCRHIIAEGERLGQLPVEGAQS